MANSVEISDLEQKLLYKSDVIEQVRNRFGIDTLILNLEGRKQIDVHARNIIKNYLEGANINEMDVDDAIKVRALVGVSNYRDMLYREASFCFVQAAKAAFKLRYYYETIELAESAVVANKNAEKFLSDVFNSEEYRNNELKEKASRVHFAYQSNRQFQERRGGYGRLKQDNRNCYSLIVKAHTELSKTKGRDHLKKARRYLIQLGDSCAHRTINPYNSELFMDALNAYASVTGMQISGIPYNILRQRLTNLHLK